MLRLIRTGLPEEDTAAGLGEPPAGIADTNGLPPQRARLARYLAWRASVDAEVEQLQAGRAKLQHQIEKAEAAKAQCAAEAKAGARSIVDRIKAGLDWTLNGAVSIAHVNASQALASSTPDLEVAKAALAALEQEIEAKQAISAMLVGRHADFMNAALREEAAYVATEYRFAIEGVIECATRLEALELLCGGGHEGRVAGELPGFALAGHDHPIIPIVINPSEVAAALSVWREQARKWAADPHAMPELDFAPHNPGAPDNTPYEQRSRAERTVIDAQNVMKGI